MLRLRILLESTEDVGVATVYKGYRFSDIFGGVDGEKPVC